MDDPKFGTFENGQWNGLMRELVTKQTDMVLSAMRVNAEREAVVDFTSPYLVIHQIQWYANFEKNVEGC